VSLNQRPLSSAFHTSAPPSTIHSNFPLLIRTFFQLSVAGSGLGGVVHARQPLAQYRLRNEPDWSMAQYEKGCMLAHQAWRYWKAEQDNRKLIIRLHATFAVRKLDSRSPLPAQ